MKLLFLDMDGVVNSEACYKKGLFKTDFPVDSYMAFLVGKIVLDTDCKVVLSSSWRHSKENVKQIHERMVPIYDITGSEPHDDTRPPGIENCQRGREIKAWLDKWNSKTYEAGYSGPLMNETITAYAILDDENDMLPEQQSNFFKTSWSTGITKEISDAVIAHLNSV